MSIQDAAKSELFIFVVFILLAMTPRLCPLNYRRLPLDFRPRTTFSHVTCSLILSTDFSLLSP